MRISSFKWRLIAWAGLLAAVAFVYRFVFRAEVFAANDFFRIYVPDAFFTLESLKHGELPLWNPYQRLGQPFLGNPLTQALYPPRLLPVLVAGPFWGTTIEQVLHVVLAASGTALAARKLGASRAASLLSGATLGLGVLSPMALLNVNGAIAWSGWMAASSLDLARRPGWAPAAWLAIFTCLSFLSGLPEALLWQGP
ncbi:MAG: hypothetical protein HY901_14440, partial [Deltaproteobacteria bacterium]|nr:hypothetical protein [Deltaproteobacteria bacterium]